MREHQRARKREREGERAREREREQERERKRESKIYANRQTEIDEDSSAALEGKSDLN